MEPPMAVSTMFENYRKMVVNPPWLHSSKAAPSYRFKHHYDDEDEKTTRRVVNERNMKSLDMCMDEFREMFTGEYGLLFLADIEKWAKSAPRSEVRASAPPLIDFISGPIEWALKLLRKKAHDAASQYDTIEIVLRRYEAEKTIGGFYMVVESVLNLLDDGNRRIASDGFTPTPSVNQAVVSRVEDIESQTKDRKTPVTKTDSPPPKKAPLNVFERMQHQGESKMQIVILNLPEAGQTALAWTDDMLLHKEGPGMAPDGGNFYKSEESNNFLSVSRATPDSLSCNTESVVVVPVDWTHVERGGVEPVMSTLRAGLASAKSKGVSTTRPPAVLLVVDNITHFGAATAEYISEHFDFTSLKKDGLVSRARLVIVATSGYYCENEHRLVESLEKTAVPSLVSRESRTGFQQFYALAMSRINDAWSEFLSDCDTTQNPFREVAAIANHTWHLMSTELYMESLCWPAQFAKESKTLREISRGLRRSVLMPRARFLHAGNARLYLDTMMAAIRSMNKNFVAPEPADGTLRSFCNALAQLLPDFVHASFGQPELLDVMVDLPMKLPPQCIALQRRPAVGSKPYQTSLLGKRKRRYGAIDLYLDFERRPEKRVCVEQERPTRTASRRASFSVITQSTQERGV